MAGLDYRDCDLCGRGKVFYDSNLNYEYDENGQPPIPESDYIRYAGKVSRGMKLERLGDWAVICRECAKTNKCVVVPLDSSTGDEGIDNE